MAGDTYVGELTNFVSHGNVSKRNFYDKDPLKPVRMSLWRVCMSQRQGILILTSKNNILLKEGLKKITRIGPILNSFLFQEIHCALEGSFKVHKMRI